MMRDWREARPDLDPRPLAILGRIERLSAHLRRRSATWLKPFNLTWENFSLIVTLRRCGPPFALRPTDLYRESLLSSGAVTTRIDRVEALGLVRREPDPHDGRSSRVVLTKLGRSVADRAIAAHFEHLSLAFAGLAWEKHDRLAALLAELLAEFEIEP